jgi:hypothetical protein
MKKAIYTYTNTRKSWIEKKCDVIVLISIRRTRENKEMWSFFFLQKEVIYNAREVAFARLWQIHTGIGDLGFRKL